MKTVNFNNTIWHLLDNGDVENISGIYFNIFTKNSNVNIDALPVGLFEEMESRYKNGQLCSCGQKNPFGADECISCMKFL